MQYMAYFQNTNLCNQAHPCHISFIIWQKDNFLKADVITLTTRDENFFDLYW